jgi:hypothetical protein
MLLQLLITEKLCSMYLSHLSHVSCEQKNKSYEDEYKYIKETDLSFQCTEIDLPKYEYKLKKKVKYPCNRLWGSRRNLRHRSSHIY